MWFLVFVLVASGVGIVAVLIRNRRPTSMEASIHEFERSLDALAPERDGEWFDTSDLRRDPDPEQRGADDPV